MAQYGLSKPRIGKLDPATGTYSKVFRCGKAVSTGVIPNYSEASTYGDNQLAEYLKEFKNADVAMGVTRLPIIALETMFGHEVEEDTGNIIYSINDSANYVGYGFCVNEMNEGVQSVTACFLPKVKFTESAESYETKGDSIVFKTPALAGKAAANAKGEWKEVQTFATEDLADAWIQKKFEVEI